MKVTRLCTALVVAWLVQTGTSWAYDVDWLDKLSGPGGFWSAYVDYRFACFSRASAQNDFRQLGDLAERDAMLKIFLPPLSRTGRLVPLQPVSELPTNADAVRALFTQNAPNYQAERLTYRKRTARNTCDQDEKVSFYLTGGLGYSWSRFNNLFPEDPKNSAYGVNILTSELGIGFPVVRSLDIVSAVGVSRFSGDSFDSFNRLSLTFLSLDWAPLELSGEPSQRKRAIRVSLAFTMFAPGFDEDDFCNRSCSGARDYEAGAEVVPRLRIRIDPVVFLRN